MAVAAFAGLSWGGTSVGCSDCQVTGQPAIDYLDGSTRDGYYESSGWNDAWLHFPQGRTYRFRHGLKTEDYSMVTYVGFDPRPFEERGASENTGNMGLIEQVTPEYFQVRNDTCAEMYIRVIAVAHGGLGGMGGSDFGAATAR